MKAMEKGYDAIAYASHTNDVSKLPEIFVDTVDFKPSEKVKKNIEREFGPDVAEKAGYLTAMQAKYLSHGKAAEKVKIALEKAKAENRNLTKEEWKKIIEENNGQLPPSDTYKSPSGKTELTFETIELDGDRAVVYYNDGAAYQKAILVKIDGKWFISSIEAIEVHF